MARQAKTPKTVNDVLRSPAKRESGSQASGPGGTRTHTSFEGLRILSEHHADSESAGNTEVTQTAKTPTARRLRKTGWDADTWVQLERLPSLGSRIGGGE